MILSEVAVAVLVAVISVPIGQYGYSGCLRLVKNPSFHGKSRGPPPLGLAYEAQDEVEMRHSYREDEAM
jgi:hypothetical protein